MTIGVQQLMLAVERTKDAFHEAVYTARDVDAALAVIADDCSLTNLPLGIGASTADGIGRYLADDVLPHLPADLTFRKVSRTGDRWRVVDEVIIGFTHDRELPWLLPAIAATQHRVSVLAISVVTVRRARITNHRTLWDHCGLLAQLRLNKPDRSAAR